MDPPWGSNIFRRYGPLFPEVLFQHKFPGLSRVLRPAALMPAGASIAAAAAVPGGGGQLPVPESGTLPPQGKQFSSVPYFMVSIQPIRFLNFLLRLRS